MNGITKTHHHHHIRKKMIRLRFMQKKTINPFAYTEINRKLETTFG